MYGFLRIKVISQLANGEPEKMLSPGLITALRRVWLSSQACKEPVCMSGGVAQDGAVREAMSKATGTDYKSTTRLHNISELLGRRFSYYKSAGYDS